VAEGGNMGTLANKLPHYTVDIALRVIL